MYSVPSLRMYPSPSYLNSVHLQKLDLRPTEWREVPFWPGGGTAEHGSSSIQTREKIKGSQGLETRVVHIIFPLRRSCADSKRWTGVSTGVQQTEELSHSLYSYLRSTFYIYISIIFLLYFYYIHLITSIVIFDFCCYTN